MIRMAAMYNPVFACRPQLLFIVNGHPVINASVSEVLRTWPPPASSEPSIESKDLVSNIWGHLPRAVIRLASLSNQESLSRMSVTTERTVIFAASIPERRGTVSVQKMRLTPRDHNFVQDDSVKSP